MESQTGDLMARMAVSVDSPAFHWRDGFTKHHTSAKYSQTGNSEAAALVSAGDFTTSKENSEFSFCGTILSGILGGISGKESTCHCRRQETWV